MARDYSSRPNSSATHKRKKPRSTPAAKPTRAKRAPRSGPPGWVWMLCGLCIGLTVAAGLYIFARPAGTTLAREQIAIPEPAKTRDEKSSSQDKRAASASDKEEEPRFSFYKMLPNYEVVIPEEEYPQSDAEPGERPAPPPSQDEVGSPQPTTPKVEEPGRYVVQAGSFSSHKDADRRKAELGLLGMSARIVEVDLDSGKTVYRVQSKTISSSDELNKLLKRLRENRIDTLVMRAKQ